MPERPPNSKETLAILSGGFAPDTEMPRHSVTKQSRRELEEATKRAEAAESRLSSVEAELEARIVRLEDKVAANFARRGLLEVELGANRAALQLLRDRGTEQVDVNNSGPERPVVNESAENLNSDGTEQGGGDG